MLTGTSPLTSRRSSAACCLAGPSVNWAFRQRPFTTSEAILLCIARQRRCVPCVIKWPIQIQMIQRFSKNSLRTYTHTYAGKFIILSVLSVSSVFPFLFQLTQKYKTMNTQHYNPNLRLSPHFRLGEFTRSITAERLGISNEPGYEQLLVGALWSPYAPAIHSAAGGTAAERDLV